MGLTYSIERELITVIAEGSFGVGDVHATFAKIRSEFDSSVPLQILIVDHGSEFEPNREEVQELARGWGEIFRNVPVRIALLVDKDIHYGLGRMASVYAEQHDLPFDVFRHSLDAMQWLAKDETAGRMYVRPSARPPS
jgi:3'-phosphoadenosine 5'-phosphosulfate sulfotransferase (PAPS reductase)/FAD synthetase